MNKVKYWVVMVLAAVVASGTFEVAKAQVLQRILDSGELRVGVSGNQPPFNTKNRSGELMGLEIDLANMFAAAFGVDVSSR